MGLCAKAQRTLDRVVVPGAYLYWMRQDEAEKANLEWNHLIFNTQY